MSRFIWLAVMIFSFPAYAGDATALCQFWSAHKPPMDAAYKPGVDVHGKPVVPADINAQMPDLPPSRISFPLTVDLAKQFNIPVPEGMKLDADMGMIDVYTDGRIMYNGQDMGAQAAASCAEKPLQEESKKELQEPVQAPVPTPVKEQLKEEDKDVIWGEGH